MDTLRIIGWTVAGGVAGFLLGAVGASVAAAALHMSRMEGGPGFFVAGIGLLTGVAGALASMMFALHSRGVAVESLFRGSLAIAGGGALLAVAAYQLYQRSQDRFTKKYGSVAVEFELRPPAERVVSVPGLTAEFHEAELTSTLNWNADHPLSGSARLYRLTTDRRVVLGLPGGQSLTFPLKIPRDPSEARGREWSAWSGVVPESGAAWAIRYRVPL